MLLPKDRTGLHILVLAGVLVAATASVPWVTRPGRMAGRLSIVILALPALYFLGCLRLTWFKEWQWNADVQRAWWVTAWYNQTYGVRRVASSWQYSAALNFYRSTSGRESIGEIGGGNPIARGQELYVLHWGFDQQLVREEGLRVVYRSNDTEMIVAINPAVEQRQSK